MIKHASNCAQRGHPPGSNVLCTCGEHQRFVDGKRQARMAKVDALPPAVRELVHDYGLNVVMSFMQCGVSNPRHMRHLVETILDEFSPTRGSYSAQGPKTALADPMAAA